MSISHVTISGMDIYIGGYEDIDDYLPAAQSEDINYITLGKRRRERALTYTLINYAAASLPRFAAMGGRALRHHPNGAPYFDFENAPYISLSHCRTGACIAISGNARNFGVDIEDYSEKLSRVKSKFINETDEKAIAEFTASFPPCLEHNTIQYPFVGVHPGVSDTDHQINRRRVLQNPQIVGLHPGAAVNYHLTIRRLHRGAALQIGRNIESCNNLPVGSSDDSSEGAKIENVALLLAWTVKEAAFKAARIDNLTLRDITIHTISHSYLSLDSQSSTLDLPLVSAAHLHLRCTSFLTPTRCLTVAVANYS